MKKKNILLLIIILLLSSLAPVTASGSESEIYFILDTGIIFIWKNSGGHWQGGAAPGEIFTSGYIKELAPKGINLEEISHVEVYPYHPGIDINAKNFFWNKTKYSQNQIDYDKNYYKYASTNINFHLVSLGDKNTGKLEVQYTTTLVPVAEQFNVKEQLEIPGGEQLIYDLMGLTSETAPKEIKEALEVLRPSQFSSNVEGYLFFVPTVIEYHVQRGGATDPLGHHGYTFSAFNKATVMNGVQSNQFSFWMLRPPGTKENESAEFLIELSAYNRQGTDTHITKEIFPLQHFKLDKDNHYYTSDFKADYTPMEATIWRKGVELEGLSENFKKGYYRGYTREYNGETYFYFDDWNSIADGQMYPTKYLLEKYPVEAVRSFIGKFGHSSLEAWDAKVK